MEKESIFKTFAVAAIICIFCSVIVSVTSTVLKPRQQENKLVDKQLNVLRAAGMVGVRETPNAAKVKELFGKIESVVVDLKTGESVPDADPLVLDAKKVTPIPSDKDVAGIKARPDQVVVYIVKEGKGEIQSVVLPIYGRGLWSTMYGFLALKGDLKTVGNLTFYEQGETPGLGGEISNPAWTGKWTGKQAFNADGLPVVRVIKGNVDPKDALVQEKVDGISGATLTGNGVNHTVAYWLGKDGFGGWLNKMKENK